MASPLSRWLATLDVDRLVELLVRRPETLASPTVTDLSELAARLQERHHVSAALHALPLPAVQVIEVIQAFGAPSVGRDQVAAALGRTVDDPDLAATLAVLAQRALVWPDGDELRMAGPLWSAFRHPLRLGAPAVRLLDKLTVAQLRGIAARHRVPASHGREALAKAIARHLADADMVRDLVAAAPADTRTLLEAAARDGPLVAAPVRYSGGPRDLPDGAAWAVERGLLLADDWDHLQLPGEVGMALRGPEWRAPFDPHPPEFAAVEAPADTVRREAAAAAADAVVRLTGLLDECARTPVALLKTGGVGTREVRRLARAVGCEEPEVRLWLELAYAVGLTGVADGTLLASDAYDAWAAAAPEHRLAPLVRAWLRLPASPLAHRPGPATPVLVRDPAALGAADLRTDLLSHIAELPAGHGAAEPAAVLSAMRWRTPLAVRPADVAESLAAGIWREAHLLAVLAHGALTPVGRAVFTDEPDEDADDPIAVAAADLLPDPVGEALFQTDLTVVVPGIPAPALATLLDAAADRESRGGATTWRFSPTSLRAALDAGRTAADLLDALRAVAAGGALPQPLEYLIADVARRHGAVRVRAVRCVVRADDTRLLAEIARARALRPLCLTVLAPTVLGSARPVDETLAALRAEGYAPVGEDSSGATTVERAPRPRVAARPRIAHVRATPRTSRHGRPADPRTLAEALLAAPPPDPTGQLAKVISMRLRDDAGLARRPDDAPAGGTSPDSVAAAINRYAAHLSGSEQALLARSIVNGSAVRITYTNAGGRSSARVIEPVELDRHLLTAWCHLRDEERMFALDRIDAVARA
ncbi:MAG TPA: helicase-associated domain-containing protein [Pilimelia sp.]|nr:helicase-associated domain-containing protein [Pilimelia sp.]